MPPIAVIRVVGAQLALALVGLGATLIPIVMKVRLRGSFKTNAKVTAQSLSPSTTLAVLSLPVRTMVGGGLGLPLRKGLNGAL